jgi:undecaprenyl-diphosphatase
VAGLFSGVICIKKQFEYIIPFYATVLGSTGMVYVIKAVTARPRPTMVGVYAEKLFSFPSLHSIVAAVVYGFIAYWLVQQTKNWKTRLNVIFGQCVLILAIGFSRLYLGVHFFKRCRGGVSAGNSMVVDRGKFGANFKPKH